MWRRERERARESERERQQRERERERERERDERRQSEETREMRDSWKKTHLHSVHHCDTSIPASRTHRITPN